VILQRSWFGFSRPSRPDALNHRQLPSHLPQQIQLASDLASRFELALPRWMK
jgi:hypothetical protein